MHKTKPNTLTAGTIKKTFKGTMDRKFFASDNEIVFLNSVKVTAAY